MFANGKRFGHYWTQAVQQQELFRKKHQDAANHLSKRTDQLFGLEKCATSLTPQGSKTNRKRSQSKIAGACQKRAKVESLWQEVEMPQCSSIPLAFSNEIEDEIEEEPIYYAYGKAVRQ